MEIFRRSPVKYPANRGGRLGMSCYLRIRATARRVRARGLQAHISPVVVRMPSCGACRQFDLSVKYSGYPSRSLGVAGVSGQPALLFG